VLEGRVGSRNEAAHEKPTFHSREALPPSALAEAEFQ
jgi:hypothetical protein